MSVAENAGGSVLLGWHRSPEGGTWGVMSPSDPTQLHLDIRTKRQQNVRAGVAADQENFPRLQEFYGLHPD